MPNNTPSVGPSGTIYEHSRDENRTRVLFCHDLRGVGRRLPDAPVRRRIDPVQLRVGAIAPRRVVQSTYPTLSTSMSREKLAGKVPGMKDESKGSDLQELLVEAGRRHHEAFMATDGDDPEWPFWYAEYLEPRITKVLGTRPTRSRLVQCLLNAEEEHLSSGDGRPWSEFYARYILELADDKIAPTPEPGES